MEGDRVNFRIFKICPSSYIEVKGLFLAFWVDLWVNKVFHILHVNDESNLLMLLASLVTSLVYLSLVHIYMGENDYKTNVS